MRIFCVQIEQKMATRNANRPTKGLDVQRPLAIVRELEQLDTLEGLPVPQALEDSIAAKHESGTAAAMVRI